MSTTTISIRVPDDDLAEIDRRRAALGMNRTAFLLRTVLGAATQDERRLKDHEQRLKDLEEQVFRIGYRP
jgi:predicted DNA binding CopG/RHH family protein